MAYNILLVHPSRTLHSVIKRYSDSELNDAVMKVVTKGSNAVEMLRKEHYDLIISGMELPDMDAIELYFQSQQIAINDNTPLVLMTASPTRQNIKRLSDAGISNILRLPFSATDFNRVVSQANPPVGQRRHPRISVDGLVAFFDGGDARWEGKVVNIGSGGVLSDMDYIASFDSLLGCIPMTLEYNSPDGEEFVIEGEVQFLRMEVKSWKGLDEPLVLRVAWRLESMSEMDRELLESILDTEHERLWGPSD